MGNKRYGDWDGVPIVFDDENAWLWHRGDELWKPMHIADAQAQAKVLTADQFKALFGDLPAAPI